MSAMLGIFFRDGRPVDRPILARMAETLAHRGPDAVGLWTEGSIGLGHRMLWTTPQSLREGLPMVSHAGDLVITADARIDNRDELISLLGFTGRPSEEILDSELILGAFQKWGERCPEKLIGDFAFAIWDKRAQELFCARDHLGARPFNYFRTDQLFAFASEIKALFCLPEIPRRLNEVRVAEHLVPLFVDKTITYYRDVRRLAPAHNMIISPQRVVDRKYWALDASRELRLGSDDAYAEAFREQLAEAVRCRLRSAYPTGSMLSGGLDSSSIACTGRDVLAERGSPPLHTFSAIFPGLPEGDLRKLDERRYINAVLDMGAFQPHFVRADRLSPLVDIDRVLWHLDEAFLAPNLYMHWGLYSAANQAGVRVLLDGIDGDTTVSYGLESLADLARTGRWKSLVKEATAISEKSTSYFTPRRVAWQYGIRPLVPEPIAHVWRVLRGRKRPRWSDTAIVNPVFAERIGLEKRAQSLLSNGSTPARTAREKHLHSLTSGLIPYTLELLNKAAAAFSLEACYPFFDRRLVEFCLALPSEQKLHQGWTRIVMHRAMEGILPPEVQWRFRKANLSPNFQRNLVDCERETMEEVVIDEPHTIEEYADITALRAAYRRYTSHPMQKDKDALIVYGAVTLALWLRRSELAP